MTTKYKPKPKIKKEKKSKTEALNEKVEEYNEKGHQLVIYEGRVLESTPVPRGYPGRSWQNFTSVEDLYKFCKENSVDIASGTSICLIYNNADHSIINSNVGFVDTGSPEEVVFDSNKDAADYINENKLRPSIYILPPDFRDQVENFFAGKICFFQNYETIYRAYSAELELVQTKDPDALPILRKKYEHVVIDTLYGIDLEDEESDEESED